MHPDSSILLSAHCDFRALAPSLPACPNGEHYFHRRSAALCFRPSPEKMKSKGAKKTRKQSKTADNSKMGQDLFTYLPSEIILDILSRLPARTIMSCKCVCKPWLNLLETREFVKSHHSKSVPGLAVFEWETQSKPYKIGEFVDEVDDLNCDEHHWNEVFNFDLPICEPLHSSANGLLFLCKGDIRGCDLFICNPITRDYIMVPSHWEVSSTPLFRMEIYGFGVSRMSDQYKLVMILQTPPFKVYEFECHVYTVGTGSWRRIASGSPLRYPDCIVGAFLNGNLHWLASEGSTVQISCLDLETELFSTFSPPPLHDPHKDRNLSVLGDCLCVCDNWPDDELTSGYEIDIWLMKEYGDEKSWTKEFVIRKVDVDEFLGFLSPIKLFKNGDILMVLAGCQLLFYSSKTATIREIDLSGMDGDIVSCATIYAPSFLPLKSFVMEDVSSF